MKKCTKCLKTLDLAFFGKDKNKKDGHSHRCKACRQTADRDRHARNPEIKNAQSRRAYAANPEKHSALTRKWYAANKATRNAKSKEWYLANREKVLAKNRKWRLLNPERHRFLISRWSAQNPTAAYALNAKRRAAKIQRTPKWLTPDDFKNMEAIYQMARDLTTLTGEIYEVDHIIPLQGSRASGLHVPTNLQVISAAENRAKYNKWEP